MDGTRLQGLIHKGYTKAAKHIGFAFDQYRAQSALDPLDEDNKLRTITASLSAEGSYLRPNGQGKPIWRVLIDGTLTQVGDYLVSTQGTYFIASMQPLLPIQAIECNRTITIKRPTGNSGYGASGYGGDTIDTRGALMTNWPASILQGTKGEKSEVALPGDTRSPWWAILLPHYEGIILESSDIVNDELGRQYIISSAELIDMGWRITAQQAQT